MNRVFKITILGIVLSTILACTSYQKVLKSTDTSLKLRTANMLYNQGRYDKALELYENILPFYKASAEAEDVYYHYAKAHYMSGQYILGSYHLKNFISTYPQSNYVEECTFLVGKCYALLSPSYKLDQEYSAKAMGELQNFVNAYPQSQYKEEANHLTDQIHQRLDMKARNAAILYYNINNYNACAVTLKDYLLDFPDTPYAEWAQWMIAKCLYLYSNYSIEAHKEERMRKALQGCKDYLSKYNDSVHSNDVKGYAQTITKYFKSKNITI